VLEKGRTGVIVLRKVSEIPNEGLYKKKGGYSLFSQEGMANPSARKRGAETVAHFAKNSKQKKEKEKRKLAGEGENDSRSGGKKKLEFANLRRGAN